MLSSAARAPLVGRPAGTTSTAAMMRVPMLARIHTAPRGCDARDGRLSLSSRTPAGVVVPLAPLAARRRVPAVAASASAAASLKTAPPAPLDPYSGLQRVCKTLLVGFAAAALWSVVASGGAGVVAGIGGEPLLASMSFAVGGTGSASAAASSATTAQSAWAGLAAGFLHTLCGPDHLAALAPLTIRHSRGTASALGALWGFGHSTGQLILGLVFVLLKERFHDFAPALSRWSGVVVGLTLCAIGLMGLYETYVEGHDASEEPTGEGEIPLALAGGGSTSTGKTAKGLIATYATGIVYGLQPDALFVVIPALALPTKLAAVAYCAAFVVGTVAAMGGYTAAISTSSSALTKDRPWLQAHLSTVASGVALAVGALVLAAGLGVNVPFFGGAA